MSTRSNPNRVAFAFAATGKTLVLCASLALMCTACGIRVSSSDFPVFRLSEPEPAAKPVAQAQPPAN